MIAQCGAKSQERKCSRLIGNNDERGVSGIAVEADGILSHQEAMEDLSPFLGQVSPEVRTTHGVLTRSNAAKEQAFPMGTPKAPGGVHVGSEEGSICCDQNKPFKGISEAQSTMFFTGCSVSNWRILQP
jgi:hypothetical protein